MTKKRKFAKKCEEHEKFCWGCDKVRDKDEFGKNKRNPDGLQTYCKLCRKGTQTKAFKVNKEDNPDRQVGEYPYKQCNRCHSFRNIEAFPRNKRRGRVKPGENPYVEPMERNQHCSCCKVKECDSSVFPGLTERSRKLLDTNFRKEQEQRREESLKQEQESLETTLETMPQNLLDQLDTKEDTPEEKQKPEKPKPSLSHLISFGRPRF